MLEYYDQMQTDMFGSDHRIQAAKRQRSSNVSNQQGGGGIAPDLQVAVRPEERPEKYDVYTPKQLELDLEMQAEKSHRIGYSHCQKESRYGMNVEPSIAMRSRKEGRTDRRR